MSLSDQVCLIDFVTPAEVESGAGLWMVSSLDVEMLEVPKLEKGAINYVQAESTEVNHYGRCGRRSGSGPQVF